MVVVRYCSFICCCPGQVIHLNQQLVSAVDEYETKLQEERMQAEDLERRLEMSDTGMVFIDPCDISDVSRAFFSPRSSLSSFRYHVFVLLIESVVCHVAFLFLRLCKCLNPLRKVQCIAFMLGNEARFVAGKPPSCDWQPYHQQKENLSLSCW